jgi:hypothetical protein
MKEFSGKDTSSGNYKELVSTKGSRPTDLDRDT